MVLSIPWALRDYNYCSDLTLLIRIVLHYVLSYPTNRMHLPNVGLMLRHRLRRCPNIKTQHWLNVTGLLGKHVYTTLFCSKWLASGGPKVVVSTAAFHARARFPASAVWKKQKLFLPHPRVKGSIVESLRGREVACSASDSQGSNFESCVWRTVLSHFTILRRFSWPSLAYMCTKVA